MLARRSVLVLLAASTLVSGAAASSTAYATEPAAASPTATGSSASPSPTGSGRTGLPAKPSRDSTPPSPVAKLELTGNDAHSVQLSWVNPTDPDFAGVLIRRAAGSTPPIAASDGTLVAALNSRHSTFTDKHLTAGSGYSYAVFPRDKNHNAGLARTLSTATRTTSTATGLRGELHDSQGRAISKARVEIRDASSGNTRAVAATAANGQYSVTGLAPGSYLLCFQPGNESSAHSRTGYLPGCYRQQPHGYASTGTPVTVLAGQLTFSSIEDSAVGGAVSGRVTDSSGNGLANVLVSTFDPSTPGYGPYVALTQLDGTYTVAGLAAGSYQVCFHSQPDSGTSSTGYLDECYDDQPPHTSSGTPVAVSLGQASAGVDAELALAGAITGQVTDASNASVTGVGIEAWVSGASQLAGTSHSDTSGAYTVKGLPTGSYTLCLDGSPATSATAPYGYTDGCAADQWLTVNVVAGQATTVNGTVNQAGAVAGTVTGDNSPVAGVWVSVHDSSGDPLTSTHTDSDGDYQFNGLAAGQVTVCFDPTYTAGGYQRTCYGAQADGSGSPITVTAGQLSTADAQLQHSASITGIITDASGAVISGVLVSAYGTSFYSGYYSQTDASGSYTFSGVTADDYQICFDPAYAQGPAAGGYAAECYDNQPSAQTADPVTVGASGSVTVSAALGLGAAITGQVSGADATALGGVGVYAYEPVSGQYVAASSDYQDGSYRLPGLAEGDYLVCFEAGSVNQPSITGYLDECYADSVPVHVGAGAVTAGIDAELAIGAAISGQVTDSAGNGIPNTFVDTYGVDGSDLNPSAVTDSTGHYQLTGVPATAVVVCFEASQGGANGTGYLSECSDDQPDFSTANPVNTTVGVISSGVNAVLADAPLA
jgi:protocatechuate 3,4-dioxygenase beta subunit